MRPSPLTPAVAVATVPASRWPALLFRFFSRSVVTREAIDQAWIDSGLGRLDAATRKDIGARPQRAERSELAESWKLAAALDAMRHL